MYPIAIGRTQMIWIFFHFLQDSVVMDTLPQYDGVLHQGEEDEHHAGQEPDLHGSDSVGDRDPRSKYHLLLYMNIEYPPE